MGAASRGGFDWHIMVYHGTDENSSTYMTIYAHLSAFKASVGDNVGQGEQIRFNGKYRVQHRPTPTL